MRLGACGGEAPQNLLHIAKAIYFSWRIVHMSNVEYRQAAPCSDGPPRTLAAMKGKLMSDVELNATDRADSPCRGFAQ